jgi:hypothetical protein
LPKANRWRSRGRTAAAIAALAWARLVVAIMPFERWRSTLGYDAKEAAGRLAEARQLAAHVDWAGRLLPLRTRCLQHAMALSWILRRRGIGHQVVFAVRPAQLRGSADDLHAWVEMAGEKLIGDLPGPWVETLRIGRSLPGQSQRD